MKVSEDEKGGGRRVEEWIFAILVGEYLDRMDWIYRMGRAIYILPIIIPTFILSHFKYISQQTREITPHAPAFFNANKCSRSGGVMWVMALHHKKPLPAPLTTIAGKAEGAG